MINVWNFYEFQDFRNSGVESLNFHDFHYSGVEFNEFNYFHSSSVESFFFLMIFVFPGWNFMNFKIFIFWFGII